MTNIHAIELGQQTAAGMTPCVYQGREVTQTRQPIFDAARWLLDQGIADADDTIETWRGSTRCMTGLVGRCAQLRISEGDDGLRIKRYVPPAPPTQPDIESLNMPSAPVREPADGRLLT